MTAPLPDAAPTNWVDRHAPLGLRPWLKLGRFDRPVGLNLLENDAAAMMAVASSSGADFIRVKIYVGAMMTPFGVETAKAHDAIKARNVLGAQNVAIFADVHDRTGTPIASSGATSSPQYWLKSWPTKPNSTTYSAAVSETRSPAAPDQLAKPNSAAAR